MPTRPPLLACASSNLRGLGRGPHCAMLLLGAEVLRIVRPGGGVLAPGRVTERGRSQSSSTCAANPAGRALAIMGSADVLMERNRPAVMERLRLGADPRLIQARTTVAARPGRLHPGVRGGVDRKAYGSRRRGREQVRQPSTAAKSSAMNRPAAPTQTLSRHSPESPSDRTHRAGSGCMIR